MSMKVYMGMKIGALKNRFSKSGDDNEPKPRIDTDLPMKLHIGSRIRLSEAPFLLAGDEAGVKYPGEESLVGAYSRTTLSGLSTVRFYLKDREDTEQESMLLAVMGDDGQTVEERYLFREAAEIPLYYVSLDDVPSDGDEVNAVNFWIGENNGIIGMPLFHTPDEQTFSRLWDSENDSKIPVFTLDEKIHLDPYGDEVMDVEHLGTMLYVRSAEGLGDEYDEYLLPTVEKDDEGFRVRIWVGMSLASSDMEFPDAI